MAVTRAQRVRLGVFVATGLAVLAGGLIVLAGLKLGEKRDHYTVRFSEANMSLSGLEVGAPVKYSGVRIGRVDSITVDPKDVSVLVVQITLNGGTPVAEDSKASAGTLGITGLKYIELSRGSRAARIRAAGEEIPAGASLMDEVIDRAEVISRKVDLLLDNLNTFTNAEMRGKATKLVDHADRLLLTTEATVAENRGNLKELSQKIAQASSQFEALSRDLQGTAGRVNGLLDDAQPKVSHLLTEVGLLVSELRTTRANLDEVLANAKTTLGDQGLGKTATSANKLLERGNMLILQSQEQLDESLTHLKETSENLSIFSQRIKEDPSLLLLGKSEDKGRER
ncbi:MAG TPA: MlaD family protein [Myxococcales bacterium]|jgi:phospholipid/cholesterol/gamma-HCH transport system substrate-binding protein